MTGRQETMDNLVNGPPGLAAEEAELAMLDDDLWVLPPDQRLAAEGEEAVRQWEWAVAYALALNREAGL